jgi:hypothetical protein
MQKVNFIFILFILVFNACNDKEKEEFFTKDTLYQTQWDGQLQFVENGESDECSIFIAFGTKSQGNYIAEGLNESSNYFSDLYFDYQVNGKIIKIEGRGDNNLLFGEWWVINSSKDRIILKRDSHSKQESVLNLKFVDK